MIKVLYGILIFCSIHTINTMQSEDYYGDFPPQLYTYQDSINNTITINKWSTPFINTISINTQHEPKDYFSISLFEYAQNTFPLFNQSIAYDSGIKNSIIDNPERVVMTQQKDNENIILIPIEQTKKDALIKNNNILELALMAGYTHFKTKQADITVNETNFEIWKKLFQDFAQSKNKIANQVQQIYFSLNLIESNINMIIDLIPFLRKNFNTAEIKANLSKYSKEEQPDQLNLFLSTGEFEEENISEQENRSNNFYQTIYKYLTFKKVKDTLYQNFFRPIHNWYNYFTRSIRFWKNLFGY